MGAGTAELAKPHEDKSKAKTGISIDRSNNTSVLIENAIQDNNGQIPYSKFMEISLFGPYGYYSSGEAKINEAGGHFSTDASNAHFGASVGIAAMKTWEAMGKPDNFKLVEMGAGQGNMAKNLLTWARKNEPEFYTALNYVIVEYGKLIEKQKKTISNDRYWTLSSDKSTPEEHQQDLKKVQWIQGSAHELPLRNIEGVFVSNELPDAFPVEVVKKIDGKIKQKYVTLENDEWVEKWDDPSPEVQQHITHFADTLKIDEDAEEPINLNAIKWQHEVTGALKRGAVITIDYGMIDTSSHDRPEEATRTYPNKEKKPYNEYASPGKVDITANINFVTLKQDIEEIGDTVIFSGKETDFLVQNGFEEFVRPEVDALRNTKSISEKQSIRHRLFRDIQLGKPGFFTQVSTKGISLEMNNSDVPSFNELFDPQLFIDVGESNKQYTVTFRDPKTDEIQFVRTAKSNEEGKLSLSDLGGKNYGPFFLTSDSTYSTITDESGQVLVDSQDEKKVKKIFEDSGYDYDLPMYAFSLGKPNEQYTISIRNIKTNEGNNFTITSDEKGIMSLREVNSTYSHDFLRWGTIHSVITDSSGKVVINSNDGRGKIDKFLRKHLIDTNKKPSPENKAKQFLRRLLTNAS